MQDQLIIIGPSFTDGYMQEFWYTDVHCACARVQTVYSSSMQYLYMHNIYIYKCYVQHHVLYTYFLDKFGE